MQAEFLAVSALWFCCGAEASLPMRRELFFKTLPSDQLPIHLPWEEEQVRLVRRGGQKSGS